MNTYLLLSFSSSQRKILSSSCSVAKLCLTHCDPWTAAHQASIFLTISWSLPKFRSIESVMLSNHLIFCHSLLLLPSVFPFYHVTRCLTQYSPPPQYTFGRWMWIQGPSRKHDKPYKKIYLKHTINFIKVNPAKMPCVCNLGSSHRTCRKAKIKDHFLLH